MKNHEIADAFDLIADLLEVKGETVYRVLAYRRAATSLRSMGRDVVDVWQEGGLQEIPGVGAAIAAKIEELIRTGELAYLEELKSEIPPGVAAMIQVPGLGPKKAAQFYQELGIADLEALEAAAREGKLRALSGMGEKSEARILAGIESLARRTTRNPLGDAWPLVEELLDELRELPDVLDARPAGSLRRMRPTVGDLDLLVSASDSGPVMEAFTSHPRVARVLGRGDTKASVDFYSGMRAQLWVYPPERFGIALQYATGSMDHNVRLRELALSQGLSLSDHAITRNDGTEILCATEEEVYAVFGLPWIPPELREDRGEIQAAQAGELPDLLALEHVRADMHAHTTWSDGRASILEMAEAARERGLQALAITDHSVSLGVAGGLSAEAVRRQRAEIEAAREALGDSLVLLHGSEVEIRADGELDYDDGLLAELDIVIAALHTSLRQPRDRVTRRVLNAIENPHVDVIAHPTGRMIPTREGADLDMEAIFAAAVDHGVALEINANPARLDLEGPYARRAQELGVTLTVNTDSHHPDHLDLMHFGVATARRGWVRPENVINTWEPERLLSWLRARGE